MRQSSSPIALDRERGPPSRRAVRGSRLLLSHGVSPMSFLLKPHVNLATLVLRIALAAIFICHGYTSLLFGESAQWMSELTPLTVQVIIWSEIVGGVALLLGFLTRLAAFGL